MSFGVRVSFGRHKSGSSTTVKFKGSMKLKRRGSLVARALKLIRILR